MTILKHLMLTAAGILAAGTLHAGDVPQSSPRSVIENDQSRRAVIESQIRAIEMEKQLLIAKQSLHSVKREVQANAILPALVGVVTRQGTLVAEFVDNRGLFQVKQGQTVIRGWRLVKFVDDGVLVANGKEEKLMKVGTYGDAR